jgi:hypothetical protein
MITVGDKSIKLQIWDTVHFFNHTRPGNNPLSQSPEATTDLQQAPFWFMISPIESLSTMLRGGLKKLNSMVMLKCAL